MGKNQHSKDKLYLTAQEHSELWGGHKAKTLPFKKLPLGCCSLSLQKFDTPVCTEQGHVFDFNNIRLYSKKFQGKPKTLSAGQDFESQKNVPINPMTGEKLELKKLKPIRFSEVTSQERTDLLAVGGGTSSATASAFADGTAIFADPVSRKLLTENTHVVVNIKSGYVYAHETVEEMNKKPRNFTDLITGEKFDYKTDIVTIQDPNRPGLRDVTKFWYIVNGQKEEIMNHLTGDAIGADLSSGNQASSSSSSSSSSTGRKRPLEAIADGDGEHDDEIDNELATIEGIDKSQLAKIGEGGGKIRTNKIATTMEGNEELDSVLSATRDMIAQNKEERAEKRRKLDEENKKKEEHLKNTRTRNLIHTTGAGSKGFTSTMYDGVMENTHRWNTDAEQREVLYKKMKERKKNGKGYVKMEIAIQGGQTDKDKKAKDGSKKFNASTSTIQHKYSLNLELHCNITPHAADNFLRHCKSGYYVNTIFHRLISNFIIQGGSPDGTGHSKTSKSAFDDGAPFKDEFDSRLTTDANAKGYLCMANPGEKNQNTSQFFICLRDECPSLTNKHTVFGRVVGGKDVLEIFNYIPTGGKDKPLQQIKIEKTTVFSNPFEEYYKDVEKEEEEAKRKEKMNDDVWFSNQKDPMAEHKNRNRVEVGKYLEKSKPKISMTGSSSSSSGGFGLSLPAPTGGSGISEADLQKQLQALPENERQWAAASAKAMYEKQKKQNQGGFSFSDW